MVKQAHFKCFKRKRKRCKTSITGLGWEVDKVVLIYNKYYKNTVHDLIFSAEYWNDPILLLWYLQTIMSYAHSASMHGSMYHEFIVSY